VTALTTCLNEVNGSLLVPNLDGCIMELSCENVVKKASRLERCKHNYAIAGAEFKKQILGKLDMADF